MCTPIYSVCHWQAEFETKLSVSRIGNDLIPLRIRKRLSISIPIQIRSLPWKQCSGSMTFWGGSGSGSSDPCFWLMDPDSDPDPDPAIFVIDLQHASKKIIFNTIFSAYYFLKVHLHNFSKIKSQKESQNRRNQVFSFYFCMMIEWSGSGSIPLTSGSGSGSWRPKNMWIRWIRIRNTAWK